MATLVAIGYPDQGTAEQARDTVSKLEAELVIQADQVAAISRDMEGKYASRCGADTATATLSSSRASRTGDGAAGATLPPRLFVVCNDMHSRESGYAARAMASDRCL